MPSKISTLNTDTSNFSTERALVHLAAISQKPHYVGSNEHENVRDYIVKQLNELGLETQIQEGYTISQWGNLAKAKNILARIKGREHSKALLLLTHYDSAPHSSLGASDAGSGAVTILEGIRAFLSDKKVPKNDIIILITDAEELGLNGADLFVNKHEWAKDVGLVLNFEARGSGGPSYMLIETNGGNANLMKSFVEANPKYPVANSLAYSIYKMLPNDTDLTIFRRDGDISGFNFAFIDDHYDYHTALDTYDRLDRNTLEHQGSYLMPMLHYFSEANLNNLKSTEDYIYFNTPIINTVIYPFSWILPMLIIAIIAFVWLIIYGKRTRKLYYKEIAKGFVAFISVLVISGLVGYLVWSLLRYMYPEYGEMLHGFTYNGHTYIWTFVLLTLGICFYVYHKVYKVINTSSLLIAPLFFWILICAVIAIKLQGASFFIIPVFFALFSLFVLLRQEKPRLALMALLCFPVLMIMSPLVEMFPVGLGLKILFVSAILVVLIFGLLLPVFGFFKHKNRWSYLLFFLAFITFISAHFNSDFTKENPKPNSLVYLLDLDTNVSTWATYDDMLDDWTRNFLGDDPDVASETNQNIFASKYKSGFTYTKSAPLKSILYPEIETYDDTIVGDYRHFKISIRPQRKVDRIELFSDSTNQFITFTINGVDAYGIENDKHVPFTNRPNDRLFGYHVADDEPLDLIISVPKDQETTFTLYEASFDLLQNNQFTVPKRAKNMIPKPFVLNDAIVLKKIIKID